MFFDGLYAGLAGSGVPVVGIEGTDQRPSRIPVYKANGVSSVDSVDTQIGKLARASSPAGRGSLRLKTSAETGRCPPVEPLPLAPLPNG